MTLPNAIQKAALVTGAAGFIGFSLSKRLLELGWEVVGIDNLNDYYDPSLKQARLNILQEESRFSFKKLDISDRDAVEELFDSTSFSVVVNLAAQAGVRYSIENPRAYIDSNVVGFVNLLEGCRHSDSVRHFVYASSSSVYGANTSYPFSVQDNVDHPVSLYAATKKSNELMAHAYSHLYNLPTTGLRFFTVYGPWGRPDMALFKFAKAIRAGEPVDVYGQGDMRRDFTYIDDIVEGVCRLMTTIPEPDSSWTGDNPNPSTSACPWRVYNIGNGDPIELLRFIEVIEETLGKKAIKNLLPMQPGDVRATAADVRALSDAVGFEPSTSIEEGIKHFIDWYLQYYG